ncbi:hypothetical protein [Desulfurobacterium sp.]
MVIMETINSYKRVFFRLFIAGIFGALLFSLWKGFCFANMVSFIYGFSVVVFDFFILERFSRSFVMRKSFQRNVAFGGMFLRYFIIFPFFYYGIRLAPNFMFAIISGAVWATFAFTAITITLLKERSGWSMEDNSSRGQ